MKALLKNCFISFPVASLLQVPEEDLGSSLEAEITLTRGKPEHTALYI